MNRQEREEWEILCRQYNVDSLQEAIQGCREELEFLIHCAERLEPRTEEEETPFNISSPRRFYTPGNAVLGMQETPFLHAETPRSQEKATSRQSSCKKESTPNTTRIVW